MKCRGKENEQGQHSGAAALQRQRPEFDPDYGCRQCGFCMFTVTTWASPSTAVSSHTPKAYRFVGQLAGFRDNVTNVSDSVCVQGDQHGLGGWKDQFPRQISNTQSLK